MGPNVWPVSTAVQNVEGLMNSQVSYGLTFWSYQLNMFSPPPPHSSYQNFAIYSLHLFAFFGSYQDIPLAIRHRSTYSQNTLTTSTAFHHPQSIICLTSPFRRQYSTHNTLNKHNRQHETGARQTKTQIRCHYLFHI